MSQSKPHSVCLVAESGTAAIDRVRSLVAEGNTVHVLCCDRRTKAGLQPTGAACSIVAPRDCPPAFGVRNILDAVNADRSDAVRCTLARLCSEFHFDRIEFSTRGGLGFRAIQAKQAGLGFDDVVLTVRLDSCNAWVRDRECRWPSDVAELELNHAERYSFEHADEVLTPDSAVLAFAHRLGWCGPRKASAEIGDSQPLVTVVVPHFNLGQYLPAALDSLAAQTYRHLEVIVIDDGSTDCNSRKVFEQMRQRHPSFRFERQENAGIGATRNRGLFEARGELFVPMDADNIARPDMIERLVQGICRNPELGAMTCYFLAFPETESPTDDRFCYAFRPTGGPHTLACIRNVYGDATAIMRTAVFRSVGGYETDRDSSFEDWEAFVKLIHAGHPVGVVPEHLFYYRHREAGFSRATDDYRNRQRVLRQFAQLDRLPASERALLWAALYGFHCQAVRLRELKRYRLADYLCSLCSWAPWAKRGAKWLWDRFARVSRTEHHREAASGSMR